MRARCWACRPVGLSREHWSLWAPRCSKPCARNAPEASCQDVVNDLAVDVRQPHIAAAEAVGQPLVVETEQMQDRRVQIVDVDLVLDRVSSRTRRLRRTSGRRFNPPPAIHIVKPNGLWSRPTSHSCTCTSANCAHGVRPNSPPHSTMVSFSIPLRLQVLQAARRSACRQLWH